MSKFFHLTKKQKKYPVKRVRRMKVKIKTLNIIAVTLFFVIGFYYLIQINNLVVKGYQIKELEKKISQLKLESERLELETLQLQSMGNIEEGVEKLGMVAVGEIEYLVPISPAVAIR